MLQKGFFIKVAIEDTSMLKGIAILLILFGHTGLIPWGGAGGVALFLVLSGYGIEKSCEKKGCSNYWKKRIGKVYFPYLLYSAVICLICLVTEVISFKKACLNILGFDNGYLIDPTMWYISYIFVWYAIYYCAYVLSKKIHTDQFRWIIKVILIFSSKILFDYLYNRGFWHTESGADLYFFAFPAGVVLSFFEHITIDNRKKTVIWLSLALLLVIVCYSEKNSTNSIRAISMGMLPFALTQVIQIKGKPRDVLINFGKNSFGIYLVEGILLLNRNTVFGFFGNQMLIDSCYYLLSIGIGTLYWYIYNYLDMKYLHRIIFANNGIQ